MFNSFIQKTVIFAGNIKPLYNNNDTSNINNGILSYDEFLRSGDLLISRYPTWSWKISPVNNLKYLIKQNIISKNIDIVTTDNDIINVNFEHIAKKNVDIVDDYLLNPNIQKNNEDYVINITEYENNYYNVIICYDNYYNTPRTWLSGYDNDNNVLSMTHIKNDFLDNYFNKTISYEYNDINDEYNLCIHPCKHSIIMSNLLKNKIIEEYLIIYLSVINSIFYKLNLYL